MQDGATPETPEQPPLAISADFLTGSTEVGLDRIRTRLLDLTNRNKLINFRHSNASSLRVVDAAIDPVFARLRDGERIPFQQVPEPEADREDIPLAEDYAEELGWNTSFDLDDAGSAHDGSLPVLHYQESLDTVSRKIAAAAKTAIEESGTNMLYLVFGFLEWYEADDSKQAHMAPLMVVPVAIERNVSRGKILETILEYSGEDIETNLSLVEKMRRDFGLEIPVLDDEDTPEGYFAKFSEILKIKKRWAIRRQITLGLLSFGKLLMYRDLDPKNWPVDKNIAKHPLVRELFEGSKNASVAFAEEYPIDAPELQSDVPQLIRDADSSQHSALVSALRGNNLVIEGPPGTGKSQTIVVLNLFRTAFCIPFLLSVISFSSGRAKRSKMKTSDGMHKLARLGDVRVCTRTDANRSARALVAVTQIVPYSFNRLLLSPTHSAVVQFSSVRAILSLFLSLQLDTLPIYRATSGDS